MQLLHSARGRLNKRPRGMSFVIEALSTDSSVENDTFSSGSPHKRARKTSQLPQFDIYRDENFRADSPEFYGSKSLTLGLIERQTEKIWPYISVEIALNRTKKAPKILQNWLKNQLNDHISTFFTIFFLFFYSFFIFNSIK
jgi:hypothetical protein